MRTFKTLLMVIGAVTVLVLAANTVAYAATGGKFVLGKVNKANKVSTLKRTTSGPALNLVTKPGSTAPFTVTSGGKVANLNADSLDGLDATALGTRSYVWRQAVTNRSTAQYLLPLPNGSYLVSYSHHFSGLANNQAAECWVMEHGAETRYTAYSSVRNPLVAGLAWTPGLSGSGLVTKTADNQILVGCNATAQFSTDSDTPLEIVATPTTPMAAPPVVPAF